MILRDAGNLFSRKLSSVFIKRKLKGCPGLKAYVMENHLNLKHYMSTFKKKKQTTP